MKCLFMIAVLALTATVGAAGAHAQTSQEKEAARVATRDKLSTLLTNVGQRKEVNIEFKQSTASPYVFGGVMRVGLKNTESLEITVTVRPDATLDFRVYPHYKGGYINVDKAKNISGLMRKLLAMSASNFLYWAIDDAGDVFAGYTITLESGFPPEAITVVLYSIKNTDGFVGELRTYIEGSAAGGN